MKQFKALAIAGLVTAMGTTSAYAALDTDTATVDMNIGLYASLTGLDDFTLTADGVDGAAAATYSGSDSFNLESNGQVRVSLSGGDLSNGSDTVSTSYDMDNGSGTTFDTTADAVHDAAHSVSATATLGDISAQKAGAYSGDITLTVSAL